MKKYINTIFITIFALSLLGGANVASAETICETGSYGQVVCHEVPEDEPVLGEHVPVDAGLGDFITPQLLGASLLGVSGVILYRAKKFENFA